MSNDLIGPKSSEKSIQEYLRRYYSLLKSSTEFNLSDIFDSYRSSNPSLHKLISSEMVDVSAISYALPRLPTCIFSTRKVIIAQSLEQLSKAGIDISTWQLQSAKARRRLNYYDRISQTLVILANSDSDLDDFINCLVASQIERQKIAKLNNSNFSLLVNQDKANLIGVDDIGWQKLKKLFGDNWLESITQYYRYTEISIISLPQDSQVPAMIVEDWLKKISIASFIFQFNSTPIYFVSSNLHSLTNTIGGFVNQRQDYIIPHIENNYPDLYRQWVDIKNNPNSLRVIDFLYYISSKFFKDLPYEQKAKTKYEESLGIRQLKTNTQLPCEVQLIPVSAIAKSVYKDPNLTITNQDKLLSSQAYILNIEYPLGLSAYYILSGILNYFQKLKGIYVIGKAAILSGQIGDIQVPSVIFDERLNNIFKPQNIFNQYFPFKTFVSSVLQNQKAISVYGTFLENEVQLQHYTSSGFNIIEMESGPYLSAIYQHQNQTPAMPQNTVNSLDNLPFDLGIINYASDNPLTQTLGDSVMSLKGVEPTYLAALTTIQRIIDLEST